jgi:hypothetical protein
MPYRLPYKRQPSKKILAGSEQDLQNACIEFLRRRQFWVRRENSGMIRTESGSMVKIGEAGIPDLLAIRPATLDRPIAVYWFEIKKPGNKSTPIQKAKQDELRSLGCQVFEIHSLEELAQAVK